MIDGNDGKMTHGFASLSANWTWDSHQIQLPPKDLILLGVVIGNLPSVQQFAGLYTNLSGSGSGSGDHGSREHGEQNHLGYARENLPTVQQFPAYTHIPPLPPRPCIPCHAQPPPPPHPKSMAPQRNQLQPTCAMIYEYV
jgi:hypothetical protein